MRHHGKIGLMPRWEPQARDRLRDAALELFLAHGFDNVTVAQITERAGLTRRTLPRYFTDKRDVLFAGDFEQLPAVLAAAVGGARPYPAPVRGPADRTHRGRRPGRRRARRRAPRHRPGQPGAPGAGADQVRRPHQRPGRGARAAGSRRRPPPALLAPVGTAIFRAAFDRWAEQPERASLADRIRETAAELAASMHPRRPAGRPPQPASSRAGDLTPPNPVYSETAKRIAGLNDTQICAGHGTRSGAHTERCDLAGIRPSTAVLRDAQIRQGVLGWLYAGCTGWPWRRSRR